jgi:hypothetical protein
MRATWRCFQFPLFPAHIWLKGCANQAFWYLGRQEGKPKKSVHQVQHLRWRKIGNKTLTLSTDFMYEIHNKPTTTTQVAGDHGRHQSINNQLDEVQNSSEKISVSSRFGRGKVMDLEQLGVAAQ